MWGHHATSRCAALCLQKGDRSGTIDGLTEKFVSYKCVLQGVGRIVVAYAGMARIVMARIGMACILVACVVMACVVMLCILMMSI